MQAKAAMPYLLHWTHFGSLIEYGTLHNNDGGPARELVSGITLVMIKCFSSVAAACILIGYWSSATSARRNAERSLPKIATALASIESITNMRVITFDSDALATNASATEGVRRNSAARYLITQYYEDPACEMFSSYIIETSFDANATLSVNCTKLVWSNAHYREFYSDIPTTYPSCERVGLFRSGTSWFEFCVI